MSLQYQSISILCETKAVDLKLDWLLFIFTLRVKVAQLCPSLCDPMNCSLVGYSPGGRKESDTTERLHFHLLQSHWKNDYSSGKEFLCFCSRKKKEKEVHGQLFIFEYSEQTRTMCYPCLCSIQN